MDINGTRRIDRTRAAGKGGKTTSAGESGFMLPAAETPRAASVAAPTSLTALDSILALQGVGDAATGRSKGLAHGGHLLDMLDEVRDGLLSGSLSRATLHRLADAVTQRQDHFADPGLQGVLDEIELRARVELAKLEQSDRVAA